jgi:hypothetical protein
MSAEIVKCGLFRNSGYMIDLNGVINVVAGCVEFMPVGLG